MAGLVGVRPEHPIIFFDSGGTTSYDADTDLFSVDAVPIAIRFAVGGDVFFIEAGTLDIDIEVDDSGALVGGVPGDDLLLTGEIDLDGGGNEFEGVLLTGEVLTFGSLNASEGTTDVYDFQFLITGGALAGEFDGDLGGVVLTSESSNFGGDFSVSFDGEAKGVVGHLEAPPGETGACCFDNGTCEILTQDECIDDGGAYQGDDTECVPGLCLPPTGACCFPNGSCGVFSEMKCDDLGGEYQGDGTVCVPDLCPPPKGACCMPDGSCESLTQDDCIEAMGDYQGDFTVCQPGLCPPPEGACCFPNGTCLMLNADFCDAEGGLFQGGGTECEPGLCPPVKGACCMTDGTCAVITEEECDLEGGEYQGDDTVCEQGLCDLPDGACCVGGTCILLRESACDAEGGEYFGDGSRCTPGLCDDPPPTGACCLPDGSCLDDVTEDDCDEEGGDYLGDGSECTPDICLLQSCCDFGKPTSLSMIYTGEDCTATDSSQDPECDDFGALQNMVYIIANDKGNADEGKIWFEGTVTVGDLFVIDSANVRGEDKLKSNTYIHIFDVSGGNLLQKVKFHTSCSQPLDTGDQFGASLLVDCVGEDEGSCCAFGKPRSLTMFHTGDDCSATNHSQDRDKVNCEDFGPLPDMVWILSTDKENPNDAGAKVWHAAMVSEGDTYVIDAANAGEDKLTNATFIHIFDSPNGLLLQTIEFHTSCSQALKIDDQFGSAVLVDCEGEDQPLEGELCSDGVKIEVLLVQYTGDDCSATSHSQDRDKVDCDDFGPPFEPVVHIIANNDDDPNSGDIWFDGDVILGDIFGIDATNAGETKLSSNTWVHIFDMNGDLVQRVRFHTSCSQPLLVDDQFGGIRADDVVPE